MKPIFSLVVGLALCACGSMGSKPIWTEAEIPAASDRVLAEVTRMSMSKAGFPVVAEMDPQSKKITSGWDTDLAPFRGDGFRERSIVQFTPARPGRYTVQIRVQREVNMDIVRPLDLTYAKWEPDTDNEARGQRVMQYLMTMINEGFEVNDEGRR